MQSETNTPARPQVPYGLLKARIESILRDIGLQLAQEGADFTPDMRRSLRLLLWRYASADYDVLADEEATQKLLAIEGEDDEPGSQDVPRPHD